MTTRGAEARRRLRTAIASVAVLGAGALALSSCAAPAASDEASDRPSIVALGTIKQKPWVVDGEVRPRFVTTIGASFDHRVVDGDVASRFLADVASIIEEPALLLE